MNETLSMIQEPRRLAAVDIFADIRDRCADDLDLVVRTAAHAFSARTAVISLAGAEELVFAARVGTPLERLPTRQAFCSAVIASGAPVMILNANADPRFADNVFVREAPFLRFYAGAPFRAPDGSILGALAVIDTEPRFRFSDADLDALNNLACIANRLAFREAAPA